VQANLLRALPEVIAVLRDHLATRSVSENALVLLCNLATGDGKKAMVGCDARHWYFAMPVGTSKWVTCAMCVTGLFLGGRAVRIDRAGKARWGAAGGDDCPRIPFYRV